MRLWGEFACAQEPIQGENVEVQSTVQSCRVGIVDDHELLLDGLTMYMRSNAPDLDVVISVTGWFEMIRHSAFPPDVVVMDLQLQEPISIETRVRTCLAAGALVVVVSALDTDEIRESSLAAGASAFVSKSSPADSVVDAVRTAWSQKQSTVAFVDTALETLRLYADGLTPVDIGLQLGIPFEAVKSNLSRIRDHYAATGRPTRSKQDLIRRAAEDGLVS
ncbi:DNA-binding response regulator, NarL/FixJ family, contains REC and HTH domains [Agreia bicolorata]|uniref:DNA-binding response regulator, NarL/FixJ family, contains REC and HTH domains n=1 Tax=Agreia bicolorata TaxID=110935 RepID=A0A1T4XV49_9MICO|nr:DNA-binding response regulator, NarL/FixJ family, contains REC and HTH domains [Agreia bicolorata]